MSKTDEEYLEKIRSLQIGPVIDRGSTVQLPKHYRHASRFKPDGSVCWTSKREAKEIEARARDHGENITFDR